MTPRIAIPLPTSTDPDYNRRNWAAFAVAIRQAGGDPVKVGLDLDDPADVDPTGYGQEREPASAAPDPARERVDRRLLEHAEARCLPALGVCFGAQMMNVFAGGTLVQDLAILPVNHAASAAVAVAHSASIAPGSTLSGLLDASETVSSGSTTCLPVNSSHHQAVRVCGQGLVAVAYCPSDGVVEAVERPGPLLWLGVQWHPERTIGTSPSSRQLFARLVEQAAVPAGRD